MYLKHSKTYNLKASYGFTLIELLVTISIVAILLSLAAPNFSSFINRNRLATASDELFASLSYARSEALKQRKTITLCARSAIGTACDTTGNNEDYAKGWIIFHDNDTPANHSYEATDTLLRVTDKFKGTINISGDTSHPANVTFGISGRVNNGSATLTIQSDGTVFRTLELNRSGSAYFN